VYFDELMLYCSVQIISATVAIPTDLLIATLVSMGHCIASEVPTAVVTNSGI
jgi:hypothetical protein